MKLMPVVLAVTLLSSPMLASQQAQPAALIRDIASVSFTLIVKADGTVVGWGPDTDGQAARPKSPGGAITAPVTIDLPGKALQVAIGETTAYALLDDGTNEKGTVVAWGPNDEGQLGNGPMGATGELGRYPKPSVTPVRVTGLTDIIQIEDDGTVWLWGTATSGVMGDGNEPEAPDAPGGRILIPQQLKSLTNVKALSLGYGHAAALLRDGSLRMWGFNGYGQIGVPSPDSSYHPKPVKVTGIANVAAIYVGSMRSFAVRTDGSLWIWGFESIRGQGILGKNLRVPTLLELP